MSSIKYWLSAISWSVGLILLLVGIVFVFALFTLPTVRDGPRYESFPPQGGYSVEVRAIGCHIDCLVRVSLNDASSMSVLKDLPDCDLSFAHVAWSGSKFALFVDSSICGQTRLAFDASARKPVPFEELDELLGKEIIAAYQVTPAELAEHGSDVFRWAGSGNAGPLGRANAEFLKRTAKLK